MQNLTRTVHHIKHGKWKVKRAYHLSPFIASISEPFEGLLIGFRGYKYKRRQYIFGETKHQCACLSSKAVSVGKTAKKKTESKKSDDILKQSTPLGSCGVLEELQSMIKASKTKVSYVLKQNVAEDIAETIVKHRTNPFAPVLDIVAGPGFVSRELLKRGVSKVVALETKAHFLPLLSALQQDFGSDKFCFFSWHMVNLYQKLHSLPSSEAALAFQKMESQVAESLLQSSSPNTVCSLVSLGGRSDNEQFVFYILRNLPNEDPILSHGRVEFFFLVHPRFKHKLDYIASIKKTEGGVSSVVRDKLQSTHFNYVHALVHLFYDIEVLDQFSVDDFYPPFTSTKTTQDKCVDPSKRLLIRMQLKKNIDEILPLQHHTQFIYFLSQLYKKKKVRTIPTMEMLVPGCGLRMLAKGFTMMDMIITSGPEEFLKLYKMMLEWPEYTSSTLHRYLVVKMTGGVENAGLSDDDVS